MRFGLDKTHDFLGHGQGLLAVVGNGQLEQQIGKTHKSQTDLAITLHHRVDGRQGIAGHVDGVIQKAYRCPHGLFQGIKIDSCITLSVDHELGKIDGS